ncbi:amidohydrolase family protein [Gleimia sp. 6138-11-ORH1]|uniref:amidohydrolase family protein n=1 Tax=Gleimia sp. 6138-11-ORH1 TaxID=2973937 RepID=UPI0021690584|nr:amidohydrolase family protein [Gleimia sp. 6138-11-ORH1]MCS4484883.1 amidohydrolase family protein [Gleimia sp. 6138-11-ORH1]
MPALRLRGKILWQSPASVGDSPYVVKPSPSGKDTLVRPLKNPTWVQGDFLIENGRIYQVPATGSADVEGWILPGLVDVHCHIGIKMGGFATGAEMLEQARENHRSGTLLVRDCGSPNDNSHVANHPDTLRLVRAGRHLAKPKRYIQGSALELATDAQLPAAMVAQARAGDGWVKLVGDWIDRSDGTSSDLKPLWDRQALADGVAAVHEIGGRVTVHTFARATIDSLLAAQVDCIEHGTGMSAEQINEAARLGIAITPTLLQVGLFNQFAAAAGKKYPVYAEHMLALQAGHKRVLENFVDSGVRLLPGTDAGGFQPHGQLPAEMLRWKEMGFSNQQIIDMTTWQARDYLGFASLSEGAVADLVVYERNPVEDLSILATPKFVHLGQVSDESA